MMTAHGTRTTGGRPLLSEVAIWYSRQVRASEARWLQQRMIAAFPEYKLSEYFERRPSLFERAHHVVVAMADREALPVGVVVASRHSDGEPDFLHVEMTLITTPYQRSGLLLMLWRHVMRMLAADERGFPTVIVLKTYNPMVFSSLQVAARLGCGEIYPALDGGRQDSELAEWATYAAAKLCPSLTFEPETGVVRGAGVPRDFYTEMPRTNKRRVNDYFQRHLAPGDRVLCLVHFPSPTGLTHLLDRFGVTRQQACPEADASSMTAPSMRKPYEERT